LVYQREAGEEVCSSRSLFHKFIGAKGNNSDKMKKIE
jgi:hypothetical protein